MKPLLCLSLFLAMGLHATEAQDRQAIDKVVDALNDPAQRASLFTKDAEIKVDLDNLIALHQRPNVGAGLMIGMNESWSIMTVPRVVTGNIRFVSRRSAVVDGASTISGAVTLTRRVPLTIVLKRQKKVWLIESVRLASQ